MPNNINLFDTYTMIGMVREITPRQSFFKDRYFPTGEGDTFNSQKVLLEYEGGNQKMAVFVADKQGDIPVARDEFEVLEFAPPKVAPSRLLTMDQLNQRGFGEALFSDKPAAVRAQTLHLRDLQDLDARITRREEWMCAQVLINNGVDVVEYVDDKTVGRTRHLKFYQGAASDHIHTVSIKWNATGGDFFGDVTAMAQALSMRGLPAVDLVLGSTAAAEILKIDLVQKLLDNRRMQLGNIAPNVSYPGVAWMGVLNFGGFQLNVWSVYETYENESGVTTPYFPATSALVTAPDCGRLLYGAVTQIEPDEQVHTFAMPRVPKFTADRDNDVRKLRITSRPLPAPRNFLPYAYAANVV
jgi:hypothetical protein